MVPCLPHALHGLLAERLQGYLSVLPHNSVYCRSQRLRPLRSQNLRPVHDSQNIEHRSGCAVRILAFHTDDGGCPVKISVTVPERDNFRGCVGIHMNPVIVFIFFLALPPCLPPVVLLPALPQRENQHLVEFAVIRNAVYRSHYQLPHILQHKSHGYEKPH